MHQTTNCQGCWWFYWSSYWKNKRCSISRCSISRSFCCRSCICRWLRHRPGISFLGGLWRFFRWCRLLCLGVIRIFVRFSRTLPGFILSFSWFSSCWIGSIVLCVIRWASVVARSGWLLILSGLGPLSTLLVSLALPWSDSSIPQPTNIPIFPYSSTSTHPTVAAESTLA